MLRELQVLTEHPLNAPGNKNGQPFNVKSFNKPQNFMQWGSEIRPLEIQKQSESRLLEGQISNGPYVVGFQMVLTICIYINQYTTLVATG